jgi:hypothetical protein
LTVAFYCHLKYQIDLCELRLSDYRNPEILNECEIDDNTREKLLGDIKRRLTPQAVKIRSGSQLF